MIVNAVADSDPPYALVEGIRSDRALSMLIRAVAHWYAFGRYNYVIVDLTSFDDWSPRVADRLATAVMAAAEGGHWLAFFPAGPHWLRGPDVGCFHVYSDWAHAQLAMRENPYKPAKWSSQRSHAQALRISPSTVDYHLPKVFRKLNGLRRTGGGAYDGGQFGP